MRLCPSQWLFIILVVMLGVSSMLSACGKKGPLYLPGEQDKPGTSQSQAGSSNGRTGDSKTNP